MKLVTNLIFFPNLFTSLLIFGFIVVDVSMSLGIINFRTVNLILGLNPTLLISV